jgi:hypothetical protein
VGPAWSPPRRQRPASAPVATRTIPETQRAEPGQALGEATDAGWGPLLTDLLTFDQPLPNQVVEGPARLLDRWRWEQPPTLSTRPGSWPPGAAGHPGRRSGAGFLAGIVG